MNKRDHVINGVLFGAGVGFVFDPMLPTSLVESVVAIGIPVVLGTLLPDMDTAFGSHRKTFHNFLFLGGFILFPFYFGNLQYVWLGILSHFILDLLGSKRGLALLYPYSHEFDLPLGVAVNSSFATVVTLVVTAIEVGIVIAIFRITPTIMNMMGDLSTVLPF